MAGIEGCSVRRDDQVLAGELGLDPVHRRLDGPAVHPRQQAEGEEVLGPVGITRLDSELGAGLLGQRGHRHLD